MDEFVTTETLNIKGARAEGVIWEAIVNAFATRTCKAFLHYPIFINNRARREPDILILDKELGIIIIEVKGLKIRQIERISGHKWYYKDFYTNEGNPYEQAEQQMNALFEFIDQDSSLRCKISKRVLVALPDITEREWKDRGFNLLPSSPPILFKDDLNRDVLMHKLQASALYNVKESLTEKEWRTLVMLICGEDICAEPQVTEPREATEKRAPLYSTLYIASTEAELAAASTRLKEYLKKGLKVFILAKFPCKYLFEDEWIKEYKEKFLFQLHEADVNYNLTQPLEFFDGVNSESYLALFKRFPTFNEGQYRIEHAGVEEHLMIPAGAGTGKTAVMILRILYLISVQPGLELRNIFMLTFTRASAQEMKRRLKAELVNRFRLSGNPRYLEYLEELKDMQISTIHSFAKDLLNQIGYILGYGRNIALKRYTRKRKELIEQRIDAYLHNQTLKKLGLDFQHYELVNLLETFWKEMDAKGFSKGEMTNLDWGQATGAGEQLSHLLKTVLLESEEKLDQIKLQDNAITLADMVKKISEISSSKAEALKELSVDYLFVDEFQDSDDAQIRLVAQLAKTLNTRLFVVGDIKQSIYRFRGADYTAFEQLKAYAEIEFKEIPLKLNYRTSNSLLKKMGEYFNQWGEKELLKYTPDDELVSNKDSLHNTQEFIIREYQDYNPDIFESVLVEEIQKAQDVLKNNGKLKNATIALLVRTNQQAIKIKAICDRHDIQTQINIGGSFFSSEAVRDFYLLLEALLFPHYAKSLLNLVHTPFWYAPVTFDELEGLEGDNERLIEYLNEHCNLAEFQTIVSDLRVRPVFSVLRRFIKLEIFQHLMNKKSLQAVRCSNEYDKAKIHLEVAQYRKNLNLLMNQLHQEFDSTNTTLYAIYSWLGININTNRNVDEPPVRAKENQQALEIVTVHSSKGMEYSTVILPCTTQAYEIQRDSLIFDDQKKKVGWYVHKKALMNNYYEVIRTQESAEVEKEETRLLYVALTRSRDRLIILKPKKARDNTWAQQFDVRTEGVET